MVTAYEGWPMGEGGSQLQSASQVLRAYGLRVTPQRLLVVELARRQQGHFTAESVHREIVRTLPTVSMVSVYRALETLCEHGLAACTELGGPAAEYEWTEGRPHHHLICQGCGARQELPDAEMDWLRARLQARYRFRASIGHFAIFGRCSACTSCANRPAD